MKVVHCVTYSFGGAARAARRINDAEKSVGIHSSILYAVGGDERHTLAYHWKNKLYHKLFCRMNKQKEKGCSPDAFFSYDHFGFDMTKIPILQKADIIHFHWISEGMFSLKSIGQFAKMNKALVWTLHDQSPFTGGCHYSEQCDQYRENCQNCPCFGGSHRSPAFDCFQEKSDSYRDLRIYPVGVSNWITELSRESRLFRDFPATCIPNPLDTALFDVIDRKDAKRLLGLPQDKKVILFGAASVNDRRKGFTELCEALRLLPKEEYVFAVFGGRIDAVDIDRTNLISFGPINDDFHLKVIYNAADVFVCPSKYENLSCTVMEALSCGTPVTAFHIGGMEDMVQHQKNGYLAAPYNIEELAQGIQYCCNNSLRDSSRQTVLDKYSYKRIGELYKNLYNKALLS